MLENWAGGDPWLRRHLGHSTSVRNTMRTPVPATHHPLRPHAHPPDLGPRGSPQMPGCSVTTCHDLLRLSQVELLKKQMVLHPLLPILFT